MYNLLRHIRREALRADTGMSDGQLLERFIDQRDEAAFEALVRRHGPMVWGVCRRVLGNIHDTEDALQATFLVLVRKAVSVRPRELVGHWLHGVAYHTALKAKAMNLRRRSKEKEMPPPAEVSADPLQELLPFLDRELNRLPEKYRVPLVLCELEGKSRKEVARALKIPEGTLSSRLATARKKLAQRLARHGVVLTSAALAAVASSLAAAPMPAGLLGSTVKLGLAGAIVSANVAVLTEGVLKAMLLSKLRLGLVVLTMTLLGSGTAWSLRASFAAPADEKQNEVQAAPAPKKQEPAPLKEGWSYAFPIPDPQQGQGDKYVVWVEQGWLQVKRQTQAELTDWHIVLARVTDPKPPIITANKENVEVVYGGGRYSVRETFNVLRVRRERKRGPDGTFPRATYLGAEQGSRGSAGSAEQPPMVGGEYMSNWFVITVGPNKNQYDVFLRLNPQKGVNLSFQGWVGDFRRVECGDTWLIDDGESLTASRYLEAMYKEKLAREDLQAKLIGAPAPALDGKEWYNTPKALSWEALHGKVVLLDFWGTSCTSCIWALPKTEALYKKYRDQGLVVIGVAQQDSQGIAEILKKHQVTFPNVADGGKIAERFVIDGVPSYVLVDGTGKVVRRPSNDLPKEAEIKKLLAGDSK